MLFCDKVITKMLHLELIEGILWHDVSLSLKYVEFEKG